jgi:hypothetical protein
MHINDSALTWLLTFTDQLHPNKQTNSVALSPQTNYTDWATSTCQRNLVPTFVDRGVSHGQSGGSPTVVNLSFLDRRGYFFFQVASHLSSQDHVPDPLLVRKSGSAENRTRDLWVSSHQLHPMSPKIQFYSQPFLRAEAHQQKCPLQNSLLRFIARQSDNRKQSKKSN